MNKIYVLYDEIAEEEIAIFSSKNDRHATLVGKSSIQRNVKTIDFEITLYQVTQINQDGTYVFDKVIQTFDSETFNSDEK